jgi:hypothetical protein
VGVVAGVAAVAVAVVVVAEEPLGKPWLAQSTGMNSSSRLGEQNNTPRRRIRWKSKGIALNKTTRHGGAFVGNLRELRGGLKEGTFSTRDVRDAQKFDRAIFYFLIVSTFNLII